MKKRIRHIFLLMIACILGINLFQGYWLYQSYQINYRDFVRNANEALFQAVKHQELVDVGRTIGPTQFKRQAGNSIAVFHSGDGPVIGPDSLDHLMWSVDSLRPGADRRVVRIAGAVDSTTRIFEARIVADTLAREISSLLVLNKFYERSFNLPHFDSLYGQALAGKAIQARYRLDTFRLDGPKEGETLFVDLAAPNPSGREVQTSAVPVNPLSRLFVRATFPNPQTVILRRMGGLLTASFLLFLLTTGCLVYMLRTILAQKKLSEIKNDFINNMTHELKTPIATVSAAVEAMQHFSALEDKNKVGDYLEISRLELNRLSDLVEKVLNIAVEEHPDLELHAEPTDVVALLQHLIRHQELRAEKPVQIHLEHQLDDPVVRVDRVHFTNVINNLIDNAVKYSYDQVDILVTCRRDDDRWLRVSVRDNGIGIPRDYQQSIFEQFFRVPQGDLHNVKGFGLGLAYVKKIVEKHGGNIRVQSEPRKGSEFIILLPG